MVEPGLTVLGWAVVVGGVDELVGDGEADGGGGYAFEVAAPPVEVVFVGVDAFDEDE